MYKRTSTHAVVHRVIDQLDQAPHGNPLSGGNQERFVGDGVLVVAQVVADIGEQLEQHHSDVGFVAFLPRGDQSWDVVDKNLAKTGVVLCEVVDERLG